jgi:hypothetical protein
MRGRRAADATGMSFRGRSCDDRRVLRRSQARGGVALLTSALAALALWPAAAHAWGPPRLGGFAPNVMRGGPGADFLRGEEGDDRIFGRAGDDLLTGDTGPDTISGGAGKDTLTGGSGIDALTGGDGDDIVSGGFGADVIDGGAGGDALDGNQDADTIGGGPGDDLLHGGSGIDHIDGGPGDDRIFADSGGDIISGGDGSDEIVVDGASAATVRCGAGYDTVYVTVPPNATADYAGVDTAGRRAPDCEQVLLTDAVVDPSKGVTYLAGDGGGARTGTALDDVLLGGPGADTLRGLGGNDVLWGLRQAGLSSLLPDVIDSGPGDDTVYGGPGPQRISGGDGDDFLEGGIGDGTISGGAGNDTIRLRGAGTVVVKAGAGRDTIYARGGSRARVSCGSGRDTVHVDGADSVARDCERVIGTPLRRTARAAVAVRARSAITRAAVTRPTYADLVAATTGLRHWWRMSPSEQVGSSGSAYSSGLIDRVTKIQGAWFQPTTSGPTDDGDTAYESPATYPPTLYTNLEDTHLRGQFTFEGWLRPTDDTSVREVLESALRLVREADGSLHATVTSYTDPRVVDLRTAPLQLAGRWHHVAVTRTDDRIAIHVDGALAAEGPAQPVAFDYPQYMSFAGAYSNGERVWSGGLDELAIYDRALDDATVAAHARAGENGQPPVTRTLQPFGALQSPSTRVTFVTEKGGSTFRCGLDGAELAACPQDYAMTNLAAGPHELRVLATDRFGLTETTPTVLRFTVDTTLPETIALVRIANDGDRRAVVAMGSDKAGRFQCALGDLLFELPPEIDDIFWTPCDSGYVAQRGFVLQVRAVDEAGNKDPTPVRIQVPVLGQGFQAAENGMATFAGARAEVGIKGQPPFDRSPYQCRTDMGPWTGCSFAFRLPILHAGLHTIQARQRVASKGTVMTTRELAMTVTPAKRDTTIAGLQMTLVLERRTLARRSPIVRMALNRAAALRIDVVRGRKRLITVTASGAVGANLVTLPAKRLSRLATGRYGLVVTARGGSGPAAVQRLPLALVRALH